MKRVLDIDLSRFYFIKVDKTTTKGNKMDKKEKEFAGFREMIKEMVTNWNDYMIWWEDDVATIRNAEGEKMGSFQYISGGY